MTNLEFFESKAGYICCRDSASGELLYVSDNVKTAVKKKGVSSLQGKIKIGITDTGERRVEMKGDVKILGTLTV